MANLERLRRGFTLAVEQGVGRLGKGADPLLGAAIFEDELATIQVFENGLQSPGFSIRFEDIVELESLGLRELMLANHDPLQLVDFKVRGRFGSHVFPVSLYVYTTLTTVLGRMLVAQDDE